MPLPLFDLLRLRMPSLRESDCKIHLAGYDGTYDPRNLFFDGRFDAWQNWQQQRNFPRRYVVSLIQLKDKKRWLFAGVFEPGEPSEEPSAMFRGKLLTHYPMSRVIVFEPLVGRLILRHHRERSSYRKAETVKAPIEVDEFLRERLTIGEFPGYHKVRITHGELEVIVRNHVPSWRSALNNVAGVYVISDVLTGKLYVGSATGVGGIWERWCSYASEGHGGNVELRQLLADEGREYASNFEYGVLEIADTHASRDDVLERESHWKSLLRTREFGYNSN